MSLFVFNNQQKLIKSIPNRDLISVVQDQAINVSDTLFVEMPADIWGNLNEPASYLAVQDPYERFSYHMYKVSKQTTKADTVDVEAIQIGYDELKAYGYIKDRRFNNRPVLEAATAIVDGTDWQLGYVDTDLPNVNTNFYYISRLEALSKLIETTGAEVHFRVEISGNKIIAKRLDLYKKLGTFKGKRFAYGSNLLEIIKEEDTSELYTALVGRGKGEETDTGGFGRRITFADIAWSKASGKPADKPLGQEFIELPEMTAYYGYPDGEPRTGIVEFGDVEEPEQLLKATYERLVETSRPQVQFKAKVQTTGDMQLGEEVAIIRSDLGFRYKTRVFRVKRDYLNNMFTEVELGDKLTETLASRIKKIDTTNARREETIIQYIQTAANGKNKIFRGEIEPTEGMMVNDLWYKPIGDGEMEMYQWDGAIWELILSTLDTTKVQLEVDAAIAQAEEAKQAAEQSYTDSVAEAERLVQVQTDVFNSQMSDVNGEINTVKSNIDTAIANVNQEIANNFTSLSDSISEVDDIATQAKSDAQTALSNATQAKTDAQTALSNASTALGQAQSAVSTAASANNKAIKSTVIHWALSSSGTTPPTSGWSTTIPTPSSTQYTWGRTTITLNDGTTIPSYNVSKIGVKGDPGAKGDTGSQGPQGVKGDTGSQGATGSQGPKGDTGSSGADAPKITAVKQQYYLSTSNTTQSGGSWSESIPVWSTGKYYWTRVMTTYSNSTSTPSVPVLDNALNQSLVSALEAKSATQTLSTTVSQHATQIAAKASQTTVDTLAGRVSTAEGSISVQAGQIALKASQTSVDTLSGRVGTAETNISANTTAINLRATKSSVDTLTGRVTTAEGTITAQAGQIALRATTATVNALTGRVSTAEAAIVTQAGRIDLAATKSELTSAIDGIEIGGRNYWIVAESSENYSRTWASGVLYSTANALSSGLIPTEPNEQFTINYPDHNSQTLYYNKSNEYIGAFAGLRMVTPSSGQRYGYTNGSGRPTDDIPAYVSYTFRGTFLEDNPDYRIMLEKGNKATDWTPAPEDVDASIATVQANLTVEAGKITALTTRVSGAETNISNVTQTVSGINTTISTLRTDVNGKATIVALNEVKSTADGNKTTISNHAGRLTTVETNVNGLQSTVASKADKSQITQLNTSISTKVESATYNSKMTQLDNAINLRVVQGDVTAAILADKKIKDTRTTNELPSWYFTNYPSQRVEEFKTRTVVGVPGASAFVKLVTDVPWANTSGGIVVQTAYSSDGVYNRSGNSAGTAWGGWVKQTDSANVLAQVNLSTEGVLIQGKRIQLDGDVTMTSAFTTRLDTQTLTAITANITSIRSKVLVTDSVTSTHIKAENALIDTIFGTTALITRLTSKTAFINNIKAIEISADKVTTGTLNAANVNIINLNAGNIVTGTLDGITLRSSFSYAYDGTILNQGVTTISGGQLTSIGTFTHGYGSTYLWLNPDGLYGENIRADSSVRSLFKLDGKGLILRTGANMATYNHNGLTFSRGFMRYYSEDDRIEIGSNNGVTLGALVDGKDYVRRITVGGGSDSLPPFVDLWATTTMRAKLNINFNQITNANYISGANTILFHNTSNRLVQSSDGQLNLLSAHQINLGWTDGSSVTNILSVGIGQVSMFRNLNMQSNNITNQSDKRLKKDIAPTNIVALDDYRRLNIVDYSWLDPNKPSGRHLGVIAQDTPFWSMYDAETDTWLINSSKQIMYNSLGIKELVYIADRHASDILRVDTYVTQHELEIKQLKQKIEELERKIT